LNEKSNPKKADNLARTTANPTYADGSTTNQPTTKHRVGLFAEEDFAAAYELFVDPDAVFVADRFGADAGGAGEEAHARRGLKNIGAERAAVDIEFDAEIAGFAVPGNLVAGVEDNGFRENTYQNRAVSHGQSLSYAVL